MNTAVSPAERQAVARISQKILWAPVEEYRLQDGRECRECGHCRVETEYQFCDIDSRGKRVEFFECMLGSGVNDAPIDCPGLIEGEA